MNENNNSPLYKLTIGEKPTISTVTYTTNYIIAQADIILKI